MPDLQQQPVPPLFAPRDEPSVPFQKHSPTSRAAAESITPRAAQLDRDRILAFLLNAGERGATDEELQDGTGIPGSTERPRRIELQVAGKVYGPDMVYRPTKSGRGAQVWRHASFNSTPASQP